MKDSTRSGTVLRFASFEVHRRAGELCKQGRKIKLQEKPFQVLCALLEHPGEVVTREELREKLWPAATFVAFDDNLNTAVNKLRDVLGDSAEHPRYVETIPRRGYRFIAPVENVGAPSPPVTRIHVLWMAASALVALLAVLIGLNVAGLRERLLGGVAPGQITSIVVLPLDNMMGDTEQDYFVEGMHEALITDLSKIGALKVISRTSAMRYKDTGKPLPQIARELGVDAVLEGSVLRAGNQVRITVQLIEAATERYLWAESYERDLTDILTLQSEVARAIAREIQIAVTPEEAARLASVREVNPEAHRLYLLGQFHLNTWEPAEINKAIRYFQQAIALDPLYSQPHSGLATCYGATAFYGYMPPQQAYEKVKAMTARALELDSNLADAHRSYAANSFYFDWHWEKAEEEFQRAIELNPNYSSAHQFYAWFLAAMGRTEEAHTTIRRALELDPLALTAYLTASDVFYLSRQYDQAITQLQELLDLSPNAPLALSRLGWSYVQKGMFKEAIGEMEQAVTLSPDNTEILGMLGHAYAAAGQTAEARKVLDDLHGLAKKRYVLPYGFALIHTGLGENEKALEWLERAYQDRDGWMPFLQVEPRLDPLRSDPRFQDLLRRMNFPEE